ncbi:MAG: hypothetical protein FWF54_06155 [Candidatus Azobacteroides sp.]|nr:hypothetical protein [Candidatus Azobacteroides sp.]
MQSQKEIKQYLESQLRKNHVFWSFQKDSVNDLSDWNLIKYVLLHLDIPDINYLFRLYSKKKIKQVWMEELISQGDYLLSMNLCFALLYFGAKKPRQYVKMLSTRRLNKMLKNERSLS